MIISSLGAFSDTLCSKPSLLDNYLEKKYLCYLNDIVLSRIIPKTLVIREKLIWIPSFFTSTFESKIGCRIKKLVAINFFLTFKPNFCSVYYGSASVNFSHSLGNEFFF